jgi:hypothetical protein
MAMRAWGLAVLVLGLICLPAVAAEKTIGRQVQTWRPRPLSPLLPEPGPSSAGRDQASPASPATDQPPSSKSDAKGPLWEAWMTRILNGQPVILFQPSWKGTWPAPQNPWTFSLTPGVRGEPSTGFGAEVVLSGAWSLAGLKLEGDSHLLWAESSGITSWRAAISRGGLSFEVRGWVDDALRPGDLTATAALRRPF